MLYFSCVAFAQSRSRATCARAAWSIVACGVADAGSATTLIRLRMWWWIRQTTQKVVPGSALIVAVNVWPGSNGAPEFRTSSPV